MAMFLPWAAKQLFDRVKDVVVQEAEPYVEPYKQASNTIPLIFSPQQEEYSTTIWYKSLLQNPHLYDSCRVVSVTWAKALASPLSHEFIQFIVEDGRTNTRTRVFSDRTDKPEPDRVIIGREWSSTKNPSDQKDMPMPLKSLTFDPNNRPALIEFANLLQVVTARAPKYTLVNTSWTGGITGTMCWWYAQSVFDSVRSVFGGALREWQFSRYAYKMVIWDNIVTDRASMEAEAKEFKKQNISGMSYQTPANVRTKLTTEDYLSKVAKTFENEQALNEYQEALAVDGTEKLDPAALKQAIQAIEQQAEAAPPAEAEKLEDASASFVKTMREEPEKEKNLEAFEAARERLEEKERIVYPREMFHGAKTSEKFAFAQAMQAFVGGVLIAMADEESGVTANGEKPTTT